MTKQFFTILFVLLNIPLAFSQNVKISIDAPAGLNDRKAILLTREKGFAAIVHSIGLGFDTTHLRMDQNLLPDLYQLQVSKMKGSLTFFFDSGTTIRLDTSDVSKSVVTNSKSNPEWRLFQDSIQRPAEERLNVYVVREARSRKLDQPDSLSYWLGQQDLERKDLMSRTSDFIAKHPRSYVSLYLLKINWYALKNDGLFEKLDPKLSHHRNYKFLLERNKAITRAGVP